MKRFWGKVRTHNKRGRTLGFPTANVYLHRQIPEGIYISETRMGGAVFQSLTFIGVAKTFGEKMFHAETYIFDFNRNIYGKWISVRLLKKIRANQKFSSAKSLINQMKEDEIKARAFFSNLTS